MRLFLLLIGIVLAVWSGAGVLLFTKYEGDRKAEEALCRFAVCDPTRVVEDARRQNNTSDYLILLKRDPHFPFEWVELGDSLAASGKMAEAERCFREAIVLAPWWPPVLMRAVNFYFRDGKPSKALPLASRILEQVPNYDFEIFEHYNKECPDLREVLDKGLPRDNPRPARSWLGYLVNYGKRSDIQETWNWATNHGLVNAETANRYVAWLLGNRPQEAVKVWKTYLGSRAGDDYLKSNYVFNGGFELGFTGGLLDWTFRPTEGVEASTVRLNAAEGDWCLRLRFDGEHNIGAIGLRQDVVLPPGRYHFKARIRTEGLSTDQGVQLRLSPDWGSEKFSGTRPWTTVDIPITAASQARVYHIELVRTPSTMFDNRLAGTLWLDDVRIEPASRN